MTKSNTTLLSLALAANNILYYILLNLKIYPTYSEIEVQTDKLLAVGKESNFLLASPRQISCENATEETGVKISLQSKVVGYTPILKGDIMFEFKIPESQIYQNPCGENAQKSVIGKTIDVAVPSCRREGNTLWLTTHSNQVVDLVSMANRKVIEINVNLKKKMSQVKCSVPQANITATVTDFEQFVKVFGKNPLSFIKKPVFSYSYSRTV